MLECSVIKIKRSIMQISKYYLPLLKEKPQIKSVISHELMLRAGMIKQCTSGIYSWLPLGLKVLRNVENIIRKNMDEAGFIEILMPFVQDADLWRKFDFSIKSPAAK